MTHSLQVADGIISAARPATAGHSFVLEGQHHWLSFQTIAVGPTGAAVQRASSRPADKRERRPSLGACFSKLSRRCHAA
jgi:hypothetical protein